MFLMTRRVADQCRLGSVHLPVRIVKLVYWMTVQTMNWMGETIGLA